MKKILTFLVVMLTTAVFCGCDFDVDESEISRYGESYTESPEDGSDVNSELDIALAQKTYTFLLSPYTVTSRQEAFDTIYECEYYFIEGVVMGIKTTTTLPNQEQAELYYTTVAEDDPCAYISDQAVVSFAYSKDFYYDKYTPEQLCFALDKAGYDVVLNFDLKHFNKIFKKDSED